MAQAIAGRFPELLRVVFELRYAGGYTYLDRCGRTLNLIQDVDPAWIVASTALPGPHSSTLVNVENGCKFSFSSTRMDLVVERQSRDGRLDEKRVGQMASAAEDMSSIVIDQLSLQSFNRIGCRIWWLVPADKMVDANTYISLLGLHSISPVLGDAFGGKTESSAFWTVVDGVDRKFRVAVEAVERAFEVDLGETVLNVAVQSLSTSNQVRKKELLTRIRNSAITRKQPPFAVSLDVDVFRDDPEIIRAEEFVNSSVELADKGLRSAVLKAGGSK